MASGKNSYNSVIKFNELITYHISSNKIWELLGAALIRGWRLFQS